MIIYLEVVRMSRDLKGLNTPKRQFAFEEKY